MKLNQLFRKLVILFGGLLAITSISFGACSHANGEWAGSNTSHYFYCYDCNKWVNICTNKLEQVESATTHYDACTECGYKKNEKEHTFEQVESATTHYDACTECGYKKNEKEHTFEQVESATTHYDACTECGYKKNEKEHTMVNGKCTVCGYKKDCNHTFELVESATAHYDSCTKCGYRKNEEKHTFEQVASTTTHYDSCTKCGYHKNEEKHAFEQVKSATTHYDSCTKCGYHKNEEEHKFSNNVCSVCGYTKNCSHTNLSSYKYDETNHWKVCLTCNVTLEKAAHTYSGNKCTVCSQEKACTHSNSSSWKKNGTYHWKICNDCGVETVEKEKHTFKNDECTVCGYDRDSKDYDTDISVSPRSGSYVGYGDRIKITVEDDNGVDYVEYYWNDDDSTKKYSDEFSVKVPSEEGKNYLYVRAKDEDGNKCDYERFIFYVEEDYYPGNSDRTGELNKNIKELRVEIGNVDDRVVYEPGEEIEYYINYYNGTSSKLSNVKIVVEVPNANFKIVEVEDNGTKTTKKVTWNLGTLKAKEDGRVYFTMEYNDSKKVDNDLIFNVEAKIYKSSKVQDSSFTRNMIYNEKSKTEDSHIAYVSGYPDGRVKPDGTITRAEMATMIARMAGINVDSYVYKNAFSDVSANFWGAGAIQACVDNGLVEAYSYGKFEPELPATRTMISYAIAKILGVEDVEPIYIKATDTEDSKGKIPVEQMLRLNIIDGYSNGTAKPDKYITRAEAMVIINNYLFRGQLFSEKNNTFEFRQFTDLPYGHWAYNHIMEATCDHVFVRTYDGNELLAD